MAERKRYGARELYVVILDPVYGRSRAERRGQKRERVALAYVQLAGRPSARPRSMKPAPRAATASCPLIGPQHTTCMFTCVAHGEVLRAGEGSAEHERARVLRADRRVAADARRARRVACGTHERGEDVPQLASRMIMSVAVERRAGVLRRAALAAGLTLGWALRGQGADGASATVDDSAKTEHAPRLPS
jgi:hypothetical protein